MLGLERRAISEIRTQSDQHQWYLGPATSGNHRVQGLDVLVHDLVLPRRVAEIRGKTALLVQPGLHLLGSLRLFLGLVGLQPPAAPCHRPQRHRPVFQPSHCRVAVLQSSITAIFEELVVAGGDHDQVRTVPQHLGHDRPQTVTGIRQPSTIDRFDGAPFGTVGQLQVQPACERRFGRERPPANRRPAQAEDAEPVFRLFGGKFLVTEEQPPCRRRPINFVSLVEFKQPTRLTESRERIVSQRGIGDIQDHQCQLESQEREQGQKHRQKPEHSTTRAWVRRTGLSWSNRGSGGKCVHQTGGDMGLSIGRGLGYIGGRGTRSRRLA